jgi:hypothetical protein
MRLEQHERHGAELSTQLFDARIHPFFMMWWFVEVAVRDLLGQRMGALFENRQLHGIDTVIIHGIVVLRGYCSLTGIELVLIRWSRWYQHTHLRFPTRSWSSGVALLLAYGALDITEPLISPQVYGVFNENIVFVSYSLSLAHCKFDTPKLPIPP